MIAGGQLAGGLDTGRAVDEGDRAAVVDPVDLELNRAIGSIAVGGLGTHADVEGDLLAVNRGYRRTAHG